MSRRRVEAVVDRNAEFRERLEVLRALSLRHLNSDPPLAQMCPTHPLVVFAGRWRRAGGEVAYRLVLNGMVLDDDAARLATAAERWVEELALGDELLRVLDRRRRHGAGVRY